LNDFKVQCYKAEWRYWSKVAGLMIIIYPIGIPVFFFFMLFRYRDRLSEVGVRAQLGFLYDAYPRYMWWFEMADMSHKLLVTSVIAFIQPYSAQLPVAMLIVLSYLLAILIGKPYLRKSDDRLHLVAQLEILLFLVAGNITVHNPISPTAKFGRVMSAILIAMLFILIGYFVNQGFFAFSKRQKDRKIKKKELKKHEENEIYGDGVFTDNDEELSLFTKPLLLRIIPDSWWQTKYLRRFKKPKPVDTGRRLLKGLDHIDRRKLQPKKLILSDEKDIDVSKNPLANLDDLDSPSLVSQASGSPSGGQDKDEQDEAMALAAIAEDGQENIDVDDSQRSEGGERASRSSLRPNKQSS